MLQGVAPKTSVKISSSGAASALEHLARLRLDFLDRHVGKDVEGGELGGAIGIGVFGDRLERRGERRVGDDQETGHEGVGGCGSQSRRMAPKKVSTASGPPATSAFRTVAWYSLRPLTKKAACGDDTAPVGPPADDGDAGASRVGRRAGRRERRRSSVAVAGRGWPAVWARNASSIGVTPAGSATSIAASAKSRAAGSAGMELHRRRRGADAGRSLLR